MSVQVEQHGQSSVVRMVSGKVNAMDLDLCEQLSEIFTARGDARMKAIVLTGNGRAFSAGVDLPKIVAGGAAHARLFVTALARCFEDVLRCPLPVVAAIEGHAIAGGCVLASAADYRVVVNSESARLGLTELAVGVPFPTSAMEIMRWRLGDARLGRRVLLADTVPARQAVEAHLADEMAEPGALLGRALAVAHALAAVPSNTYALTKEQLQADVRERIAKRAGEWESQVRALWESESTLRSVAGFVQQTLVR